MKAASSMRYTNLWSSMKSILTSPGQARSWLKTVSAGVCHSDLHQMEGRWPIDVPVVLGHEGAGIVERVGEGWTYVQPGDHVVMNFIPSVAPVASASRVDLSSACRGAVTSSTCTRGTDRIDAYLSVSSFAEHMLVSENGVVKVREMRRWTS